MELATALIWTLRILLPIILFCIYFKLQSPKDERYPGPTDNAHSRTILLAHRKAAVGAPVPASMNNITLKNQEEAPALFAGGRGQGGGRPRRTTDETRGGPGRERRDKREKDTQKTDSDTLPEKPKAEQETRPLTPSEERMHMESLVNYVAFNRKEQQRVFLPEEHGAPPPPPPPAKKPEKDDGERAVSSDSGVAADKANAEAQMVLRGAVAVQRSEVANHLYERLSETRIEISESTFELMINACLAAEDLKNASGYLMKMESAGFLPNSDLLDKVMNLYSAQKAAKETRRPGKAEDAAAAEGGLDDDEGRTKLSATAAVFVPSFIPPPPPVGQPSPDLPAELREQRTKLTAESKPFEPKFNVTFDPYMYTWTVDQSEEFSKGQDGGKGQDSSKGQNGKGKDKGKDKGKGKGKDRGDGDGKGWEARGNNWSSDAKWSSDANWSSDAHWSSNVSWDADKAKQKVWVEKQPKDAENAKNESGWREGKKNVVKTWKPKVESAESAEPKA